MGQTTKNLSLLERPSSRGRPRNDRLPEVLATAAAMFSNNGYAATTLEDIGAQLGMTRPALYYYAKSKEDLLDQCYTWTLQNFMARVEGAITEGSGRERLERFFMIYADTVCDDVGRCFLSSETHYLGPERQEVLRKRTHDVNVLVAGLLDRGAADGSLAVCEHRFMLATLFGAFNTLHAMDRRGLSPRQMGAKMLGILLSGLDPRP